MFFKRKNKKKKPEELRQHYRRAPGKKHALSVKLERGGGETVSGDLIDLSAGGAGVTFAANQDPKFEIGEKIQMHFSTLVHTGEVSADAEMVRRIDGDDKEVRYGFRFTNTEGLFHQLDPFYLKFFNRRKDVRARPALDRAFKVKLHTEGGVMDVTVHDITATGFGFVLSEANAEKLGPAGSCDAELFIPKHPEPIRWRAVIRHSTKLSAGVRIGMEFDPGDGENVADELELIKKYCAEREADMARWDAG